MNFNATLIGQSIAFLVFVVFVMKYVWPFLLQQMQSREVRISDGLTAAEEGQKTLARAKEEFSAEVEKGKSQAALIIAQAQKRSSEIVEEARKVAKDENMRIKENALNEIDQEKEKARQELKKQVSALIIAGAEQILTREVDQKTHNELLQKMSQQL